MIPLSDGIPARRFPFVNVALIVANFAVWIFYELPHLDSSVYHASFYPCTVDGTCHAPEPWGVSWFTAMFMHGSWDHILGNMLFLAIFGKNVEDAFGHLRYLAFYFAGGFVASDDPDGDDAARRHRGRRRGADARRQRRDRRRARRLLRAVSRTRGCSRWWSSSRCGSRPGSSSACGSSTSSSRATSASSRASANGGGTAFFAHVGGFVFGVFVARLLAGVMARQPAAAAS